MIRMSENNILFPFKSTAELILWLRDNVERVMHGEVSGESYVNGVLLLPKIIPVLTQGYIEILDKNLTTMQTNIITEHTQFECKYTMNVRSLNIGNSAEDWIQKFTAVPCFRNACGLITAVMHDVDIMHRHVSDMYNNIPCVFYDSNQLCIDLKSFAMDVACMKSDMSDILVLIATKTNFANIKSDAEDKLFIEFNKSKSNNNKEEKQMSKLNVRVTTKVTAETNQTTKNYDQALKDFVDRNLEDVKVPKKECPNCPSASMKVAPTILSESVEPDCAVFEVGENETSTSALLKENGEVRIKVLADLVINNKFTTMNCKYEVARDLWHTLTKESYKKSILYLLDRFFRPHSKLTCGGSEDMLAYGCGVFHHSCLCINEDWLDGPYVMIKTQHGAPCNFFVENGNVSDSLPTIVNTAADIASMKYGKIGQRGLAILIIDIPQFHFNQDEKAAPYGREEHRLFFATVPACRLNMLPNNLTFVIDGRLVTVKIEVNNAINTSNVVLCRLVSDDQFICGDDTVLALINKIAIITDKDGDIISMPTTVPFVSEFVSTFTKFLQGYDEAVDIVNGVDRDPIN